MYDVVAGLYDEKVSYIGVTNEFGSPAKKINLKYGASYIYLVDAMPENTMILANMEYLKFAQLRPQYITLQRQVQAEKDSLRWKIL